MSEIAHRHLMKARAIATHYAGAHFRSRLEARWAAFFDLCGWRWDYEPPEEDGWIPDFLLIGHSAVIKVEVKPINWVGEDMAKQIEAYSDLSKVKKYYENALERFQDQPYPLEEDILILGSYPHHYYPSDGDAVALGYLWQDGCPAVLTAVGSFDFCSEIQSYRMRMTGWYEGCVPRAEPDDIDRFWRKAGAQVQWMRNR